MAAVVLCTATATWGIDSALASCAGTPSATENMRASDAVFVGRAERVGPALALGPVVLRRQSTAFEVERSWKGVSVRRVTVGGHEVPRLDYPFEEGVQYLVYAYADGDGDDASLITNGCKQNEPVDEAEAAIRELGPATIRLREGGGTAAAVPASRVLAILGALSGAAGVIVARRGARRWIEPGGG